MGEAADASDGSKKAALFVKAVKVKIGSLEAPKLDQEMLGFVAEHLGSDAPFKAILSNNSKGALALRKRRLAFLTVKPYAELCDDLNNDNPTCGCEKPGVSPCIRVFVYGAFREILVLYHMYDNIRNGGEGINPDGYYRAFGAHADQIHLATGGLAAFLTQGEPTVVSLIMKAMDAVEVTTHGVPPIAPMQFSHLQPAFVASHDLKRGREQEGMVQQTVPPYGWVCAFCQKPNHSANVCRIRIKEEKKQRGQWQQRPVGNAPQASTTAPHVQGQEADFEMFKRFEQWRKANPS